MPEPEWTRIGVTSTDKDAFSTIYGPDGTNTYLVGKSDLYVEIYKVIDDNLPAQTNYLCVPHLKQWPGRKLDGGSPTLNKSTMLEQDWSNNTFEGAEITDWGPTKPKTGSIDWSATVSAGSGAGLSVSYDVPYISRKIIPEYNQTVGQEYTYPHTPLNPIDREARKQIVDLKNFGEALVGEPQCPGRWYEPCPQELLSVHASSEFSGYVDNPYDSYHRPTHRHITSSVDIEKFISIRTI